LKVDISTADFQGKRPALSWPYDRKIRSRCTLPIRDIIKGVWFRTFKYISNNLEEYDYLEQFANSPYSSLVDMETIEKEYMPLIKVFQEGIEQKILKNVDMNFHSAFMWHPISRLANPRLCHGLEMNEEDLEIAFTMAWDAIKL
jgi:hypothetical protein